MLFGGKIIQTQIINDAMDFAEEKNFQLIFGAMVGGCSKGVQYADSDYDTRFLYLDKNEDRIFFPWNEKEENLKHRKYFDESISPYEWIPLWEATSFFQFLKKPSIDGKQSSGLYNIVGWTLQSPYTWDPYGLSEKLIPIVNSIFRKELYIPYHVEQINLLYTEAQNDIITKNYIYAIYEALCIIYADMYDAFPPVSMMTLAAMVLDKELLNDIINMIRNAQKESEKYCLSCRSKKMHDSHFVGLIHREAKFDSIINNALERAKVNQMSTLSKSFIDEQINKIYCLMNEAIYKEQRVFRAED